MESFELKRRVVDVKELRRRSAKESDTSSIASTTGVYTLDSKPAIVYGRLNQRYDRMLWALKSTDYQTSTRTNGLKTTSRIFGFKPRIPLRADFCSATSMQSTHPKQHQIVCQFGELLSAIYRQWAPETYEKHCQELQKISAEWVIPGTPFTSGIINQNNPLKYHHDTGNFENVFSCMIVFRKDIEGGYLSLPELDTKFLLEDHTFFLFDGQAILHGVTPIKQLTSNSYRYSVVYYALRAMSDCGTCVEELNRIRVLKRQRERKRI